MAESIKQLRARYGGETLELARATQNAQRRCGGHVQSLTTILTGVVPTNRPKDVADLSARQLRKRGRYGQAALLADQEALAEKDPARAEKARELSAGLKKLARKPVQLELDFWGGNVMTADDYFDMVQARLMEMKTATANNPPRQRVTTSQVHTAIAVLSAIVRNLGWQTYSCQKTAAELGDMLDIAASHMATTLSLLEEVGAITRVKRGRTKVIAVNPEGAYRGDVRKHEEAVDKYKADVLPFRKDKYRPGQQMDIEDYTA